MTSISGRYSICDKNLGLLQELIGKDADSYREEFVEQLQHYKQTMKLLQLQPSQHRMDVQPLLELIGFLSHVSYHYPGEDFIHPHRSLELFGLSLYGQCPAF
uniref:Protein SDA1 n=1 Tax=Ascaris lumbricoides TaxID=6252 RepID=A0A0M3IX03_ASCLU